MQDRQGGERLELSQSNVELYLEKQREDLKRLGPAQAYRESEKGKGTYLVDIRPEAYRVSEGRIPGAIVLERNVLEWRLDPTSPNRIPEASPDFTPIIVCNEGYASSLAAKVLKDLGVDKATDLDGGFRRWKQEGFPVVVDSEQGPDAER